MLKNPHCPRTLNIKNNNNLEEAKTSSFPNKQDLQKSVPQDSIFFEKLLIPFINQCERYKLPSTNLYDYFIWGYLSSINENNKSFVEVLDKMLIFFRQTEGNSIAQGIKLRYYSELRKNIDYGDSSNSHNKELMQANKEVNKNSNNNHDINKNEKIVLEQIRDKNSNEDNKNPFLRPVHPILINSVNSNISSVKSNFQKLLWKNEPNKPHVSFAKEEMKSKNITCSICLESLKDTELTLLLTCKHKYHHSCLLEYTKLQINESKVPIRCPEANCKSMLIDAELKTIINDSSLLDKYYQFTLNEFMNHHAEEANWCPTPGCSYAFINEKGYDKVTEFICPKCKKHYCLNCRVIYHNGMSCDNFQNQLDNENSYEEEKEIHVDYKINTLKHIHTRKPSGELFKENDSSTNIKELIIYNNKTIDDIFNSNLRALEGHKELSGKKTPKLDLKSPKENDPKRIELNDSMIVAYNEEFGVSVIQIPNNMDFLNEVKSLHSLPILQSPSANKRQGNTANKANLQKQLDLSSQTVQPTSTPNSLSSKLQNDSKAYPLENGLGCIWTNSNNLELRTQERSKSKVKTQCECGKCIICENRVSEVATKSDKQFEKYAIGMKFKQCPACKFWVEKIDGCNHMTCRCKFSFCYLCGKGKGVCKCGTAFCLEIFDIS